MASDFTLARASFRMARIRGAGMRSGAILRKTSIPRSSRGRKNRGPSRTGRGGKSVCFWLRSGADHPCHTTRMGRMVMVVVPDVRLIFHSLKLKKTQRGVNPVLDRTNRFPCGASVRARTLFVSPGMAFLESGFSGTLPGYPIVLASAMITGWTSGSASGVPGNTTSRTSILISLVVSSR